MRFLRVLAVLPLLLVAGCGTNAQVEALEADPMGGWSPPGVREARQYVTEPGSTLGKPRYAGVLRILEVKDGAEVKSVLAEVREAAQGAGWTVRFDHPGGAFTAEKSFTVDGEELRGRLSAGPQDIGGDPGATEIYLDLQAFPA